MPNEDPLASVVIPTYNSENTLSPHLESIKRHKSIYKSILFEIIIVTSMNFTDDIVGTRL